MRERVNCRSLRCLHKGRLSQANVRLDLNSDKTGIKYPICRQTMMVLLE